MPAAPTHPHDYDYTGLRMTADEYLALGETRERYELIDGLVVRSPDEAPIHNEVLGELAYQLMKFEQRDGSVRVFHSTDVKFARNLVYRPDVAVYRHDRLAARVDRLDSPPDLVVEVVSGGTRTLDLITKRDDYDRFGVSEYWVVDPSDAAVRCWQRRGVHLLEAPLEGDAVASSALPGFSLDLRPLRAIARPG